jgi:hypothetical protein
MRYWVRQLGAHARPLKRNAAPPDGRPAYATARVLAPPVEFKGNSNQTVVPSLTKHVRVLSVEFCEVRCAKQTLDRPFC